MFALPARAAALATLVLLPAAAGAQAWLPPKGEAWLSLGYGNVFVTKHYLGTVANPGDNVESANGDIRAQSVALDVGYGVTERLALSVGIPLMISKYEGNRPHYPVKGATSGYTIDDGLYRSTFQDFTIAARYQLWNRAIAVAPFVVAVIPSHDYYTVAHSSAGRNLNEILLGFSAGTRLDRILAGSYVQAAYSYAFVEEVAGIHHDRSNGGLELGYFVTPSLALRLVGTGYYTHGGVVFKSTAAVPAELWTVHDLITHASQLILGGGVSYTLSGSTEVYVSYLTTVLGRGGHKIDQGLSFGVSWSFSPEQIIRRAFRPTPAGLASDP